MGPGGQVSCSHLRLLGYREAVTCQLALTRCPRKTHRRLDGIHALLRMQRPYEKLCPNQFDASPAGQTSRECSLIFVERQRHDFDVLLGEPFFLSRPHENLAHPFSKDHLHLSVLPSEEDDFFSRGNFGKVVRYLTAGWA